MKRLLAALVCTTALALATPAKAHAQQPASAATALSSGLGRLDADAGIVLKIDLSALGSLHTLASELFPDEKQAIGLAGIGSAAILGFYPFEEKAWKRGGFDTRAPLLVQVAAAGPAMRGLRTRAVLRADRPALARKALIAMRLADKAQPERPGSNLAQLFFGVTELPSPSLLRKQLTDAGVFLVARPRPLSGLLVAREVGGTITLDLFDPKGGSFSEALQLITREPKALSLSRPGAGELQGAPFALWLRPSYAANTLEAQAAGNRKQRRHCSRVANLARVGSTEALTVTAKTSDDALALRLVSHGRSNYQRFAPATKALVRGGSLLSLHIGVASWAALRDQDRPAFINDWDRMWANISACGTQSRLLAIGAAWPEILGSFLSEVSALHPSANAVVEALGPASASIDQRGGGAPTVLTEAWVGDSGAGFAKAWLKSLFGSEHISGSKTTWGQGAMQPYAIAGRGGSIIGSGFRPGSRAAALAASRTRAASTGPLLSLTARPSALVEAISGVPLANLWKPWQRATGSFTAAGARATLTLTLERK